MRVGNYGSMMGGCAGCAAMIEMAGLCGDICVLFFVEMFIHVVAMYESILYNVCMYNKKAHLYI